MSQNGEEEDPIEEKKEEVVEVKKEIDTEEKKEDDVDNIEAATEAQSGDGSESEEDDDEDEPKVTIDDEPYNFRAAQKQQPQSQQPKQPTIDFEASQAVLDVDINSIEDKPWRKPGADLNDYFNYGFDESTWRMYCDRQKKMKSVVNEMVEVQETHRIPVISDFNKPSHQHPYQIPIVTPMVVQQAMVGPQPTPHIQRDIGGGNDLRMNVGGGVRIPREHSSHRRSRSPHSKTSRGETSRHHNRSKETKERKRSRSRDSGHRRSSGKESRKRRSRSRERDDDRHKFKRHKSSKRV